MKASVLRENLNKGLGIVNHAISTRSTLEILGNILVKTEGGRLKLEATNLEIGISFFLGGKIEKEGEITIPARLFLELIGTIPHQKINLETKDNFLNIYSENFNSNLKGLKADEFPIIPEIKDGKKIKIKTSDLKEAVSLVVFAAATDDSRPVLSGVYFEILKGELTIAATDSYRLAEKKIKVNSKDEFKIIIPQRSLVELIRIIEDEGDAEIIVGENQISFEVGDVKFTSRLIEGEFPDYKKIIPDNLENTIEVKKSEFLDAVKAVSLFSRQTSKSVQFNVHAKGELEIISPESMIGDGNVSIEAKVEGKNKEIVFNSRYVLDILNNIKDESLIFRMSDKLSPGTFQGAETKDYIYIIMPLRG